MKLGYWNIKGRAEPLRLLLAYFKLEYTEINPQSYEEAHELFSKHHFAFPNLPYLVDEDIHVTESSAIPIYIAQKAKAVDFFGKVGLEQVYHAEIIGVIKDVFDVQVEALMNEEYFSFLQSKKDFFVRKFGELSKRLGDKEFFFSQITYADFLLFLIVRLQNSIFEFLKAPSLIIDYPYLSAHIFRMANLPGIKEYLASDSAKRLTMSSHLAKIRI